MSLRNLQRDWDYLGSVDPLFAVLTDQSRKNGKWDVDEFFQSGDQETKGLMAVAEQLGYPAERHTALDFGCGVGRLTRALATYFDRCYGVDISPSMVAKAQELNKAVDGCTFIINSEPRLRVFPDDHVDMIYSNLVLQHIPDQHAITSYVSEFVRILKKGGLLVFQVPNGVSFWHSRLKPRKTLYTVLRRLGLDERFMYEKLNLYPISMTAVPREDMLAVLRRAGAKVLEVQPPDTTYYVTKE